MDPVLIQWLVYGGLVVGGWLLRHWNVQLPGLPTVTPPSTLPSMSNFPRLQALVARLGPQAETVLGGLVSQALHDFEGKLNLPNVSPPKA